MCMNCGKDINIDFYTIHIENCGKRKITKGVTEIFKCPNCQVKLPYEEKSKHESVCKPINETNKGGFDYNDYMEGMDEDEALARALQESEEQY